MSLAPYLPPTSGETGAVFGLIQLITNPAQAKKVLEQLAKEREAIDSATAKQAEAFAEQTRELNKKKEEVLKAHRDSDHLAGKAAAGLAQTQTERLTVERIKAENDRTEQRIAELRVAMDEREVQLEARDRNLADRINAVTNHEHELKTALAKLQRQEADLAAREHGLAAEIAEHDKWLAGLRPPRIR